MPGAANCASAQYPYTSTQATISQWNFQVSGTESVGYNNPPPTTGVGEAMSLGMSNGYTFYGGGVGSIRTVT